MSGTQTDRETPGRTGLGPALGVAAVLAVWSFALYARALQFGFVDFDDKTILLAHPNLYNQDSLAASLRAIFVDYFPREEPLLLRDLSWAIDARIFGFQNPLGYHLGNVVLNALNSALVFLVALRLTRRFAASLTIGALFSVLTIHVEAVCWVMGRKDLLSACFMLTALLSQSYELESHGRRRRTLWLVGFVATIAAIYSKMGSVVFFAVLAAHRVLAPYLAGDRAPAERFGELGANARKLLPLIPHAALSVVSFFWFRGVIEAFGVIGWRGPGPLEPSHIAQVARFTPLVLVEYLRHIAWPEGLSVFYRWPHVEIPLSTGEKFLSAFSAAAWIAALGYTLARRRDLSFYLLAFLLLLVPYLNIVYVSIWVADRYVYLGSFFLLCAAVVSIAEWGERSRPLRLAGAVTGGFFFLISSTATFVQQGVWRDNESLWTHEAHLAEPSLLAIQALAKNHVREARKAPPQLRQALLEEAGALIEKGLARERALGRIETAYRTPEQLHLARLYYLQARIGALQGTSFEAQVAQLERAFAIAPDPASARRLSETYLAWGLASEAPDGEPRVRRSLAYFATSLEIAARDPVRRARALSALERTYAGRFPFLEAEVAELKSRFSP
ncbi:MAG: hypothetical protein HKP27_06570 [Myxococcales bacterium]|nr:hypothetical protein [Myxococcales bacterium]